MRGHVAVQSVSLRELFSALFALVWVRILRVLDSDVLGDIVGGEEGRVALGTREADFAVSSVYVPPEMFRSGVSCRTTLLLQ